MKICLETQKLVEIEQKCREIKKNTPVHYIVSSYIKSP
jgi:hypothetical protein